MINHKNFKLENNKEKLKEIIRTHAILFAKDGVKIINDRGKPLDWIFYNWGIGLNYEGLNLTTHCVIEALKKFKSNQIASYGMTSIPIVTSCVAMSGGLYNGLAIRKERERHGTCRQIEGRVEKDKEIIIIDDSISSGASLINAISILENEGLKVEGCICLVNIPWRGGKEKLQSMGYNVETIFDMWPDLMPPILPFQPAYKSLNPPLDNKYKIQNGLTPADTVRKMIEHFLNTGNIPQPPETFDKKYDASGGIFISLRDKKNNFRISRLGFFNIDPCVANFSRDIALATYKTVSKSHKDISHYGFEKLKVCVYLLGQQKTIKPKNIDFLNFGITIMSDVRPTNIGGALPNTQSFTSEHEQYFHAKDVNACLLPTEPFTLFQHKVLRSIETGSKWSSFGAPFEKREFDNDNVGIILLRNIESILTDIKGNKIVSELNINLENNSELYNGIGISLYQNGMIGCWTSITNNLNFDLIKATTGAWSDPRYKHDRRNVNIQDLAIVVTLFHSCESIGREEAKRAAAIIRKGLDTVVVQDQDKYAVILSYVPCHFNWTKVDLTNALLNKANIKKTIANWKVYDSICWIKQNNKIARLINGSPEKTKENYSCNDYIEQVRAIAQYIINQNSESGFPKYCYWPHLNKWVISGSALRIILSLNALYDAGLLLNENIFEIYAANNLKQILNSLVEHNGEIISTMSNLLCDQPFAHHLLFALSKSDLLSLLETTNGQLILKRIASYFHKDGCISTRPEGHKLQNDHDYLPGVVLLAISNYAILTHNDVFFINIDKNLEWYKNRFRTIHPWGMTWWHMQAWTSIYNLKKEKKYAEFVFEIADWTLDYQLKNGSFLIDLSPEGPTFHTACVLEGIADAWSLAIELEDQQRVSLYSSSWEKGIAFMTELMLYESDTFYLSRPHFAIGGVKYSPTSNVMRIDYSAHLMCALIKGIKNINKAKK